MTLVAPGPDGLKTVGHNFHPRFTYPVFGDSEEIFGYQKLAINLQYHASDMRPNVSVTYSKKFTAVGETEATDVDAILHGFLPEVAFQKKKDFETATKSLSENWTPPGELNAAFTAHEKAFEIWKGSLADPAVKQLVKRIQPLVPLFIEGGTQIDVDDEDVDRWIVFFLYQKKTAANDANGCPYLFAGYCTVYRFVHLRLPTPPQSPSEADLEKQTLSQDFDLSQLPCRSRISQFIILPPFQRQGLGPRLYSTIFQEYIKHPQTVEITVEDPNEAFDDLRDIVDLHYLRQQPAFQALRLNTDVVIPRLGMAPNNIVDKTACDAVRAQAKMAPRQFARMVEMNLLSRLPEHVRANAPEEEEEKEDGAGPAPEPTEAERHAYRLWRLLLKKRIYQQNKDALGELEIRERIAKLESTVTSVEFDYMRLLIKLEDLEKDGFGQQQENGAVANGVAGGKRKAAVDGEQSASKKARVEDER